MPTIEGIYETATGDLLRWGAVSLVAGPGETHTTNLPAEPRARHQFGEAMMSRWTGSEWVEVTQPPVEVKPMAVALSSPSRPDGTLFVTNKASGQGFILCDRDILICTATVDAAEACKDLRVAADGSRADWDEATLVGVYKLADPGEPLGALVECADQADAAANAVCTILDYVGMNQNADPKTAVAVELRGGSLYTDMYGVGLGAAPAAEEHQIYAVLAPNIPSIQGGRVTFFDAYLAGYEQAWMESISTDAMPVDPTGPAGVEGARLRVWIYYPKGHAPLHHILRLVTYRTLGTF